MGKGLRRTACCRSRLYLRVEKVKIRFLGSGDAFGSGGRFQTCIEVKTSKSHFLVDCGTSSLIAMNRFGVELNEIEMILLTHLHADHFGGIPFVLLNSQHVSKRLEQLTVAGPPGTRKRLEETMELMFPGSSQVHWRFPFRVVELEPGRNHDAGNVRVTPYRVNHECGSPPFALRIECDGKIVTYTGDTEWTETLVPAAKNADLLISEAYYFEKDVRFHLNYRTLMDHMSELQPRRFMITHMNSDMLNRLAKLRCEYSEDGKVIDL